MQPGFVEEPIALTPSSDPLHELIPHNCCHPLEKESCAQLTMAGSVKSNNDDPCKV